jgi:hypothetical protein
MAVHIPQAMSRRHELLGAGVARNAMLNGAASTAIDMALLPFWQLLPGLDHATQTPL